MANSKLFATKNKMIKLKLVMEKLQRSFSLGKRLSMSDIDELQDQHDDHEEPCYADSGSVPEDVKEGHFAVVAVDGGAEKRFVVPIRYLTHPTFVALLEKAAEEYGFDHGGALTIPCRPSEIERILAERWNGRRRSAGFRRSDIIRMNSNFMLQSC
ncbi:protein SMALL AUXIN UP-REGULATED RNA 54 [Beta vulgaris subsp. vulgaris]|uniref:protein SMALL AUXIN UP-REGULATED RNA 54 n=1 Tax=Beta vulgaris subsp. vulgaris TaxID=3555 RepID=UPI002036EBAA|nr:protein SMALL AUXIN UP-REGULATED RNA 54 [Beta vulgaris subsp. vulgaris]